MRGPIAAVVAVMLTAAAAPAALAQSTKERLDALERKLESRSLVEMLNRIEQLQRDVQQLRGDLELQLHKLENLQQQQREQYLDTDRRLQQLEAGLPPAAPGMQPGGTAGMLPGSGSGMQPPLTGTAGVQPTPGMQEAPGAPPARGMPPGAATSAPQTPPGMTAPAPSPGIAAGMPPKSQEEVRTEYDSALAILRDGRYGEAAQAFTRFLEVNPNSEYADNANYWLGETYYVTREFDKSLATFQALVTRYPQSSKVSDSHLKMGYIYYEKRDWAAAREQLNLVVSQYPGSTSARLASDRLQRMNQEGH